MSPLTCSCSWLSHRWRRWVLLRVHCVRISDSIPIFEKTSHKPRLSFQNLSMSSYYLLMNSSRRSTVSFLPQNCNSCDSWFWRRTLQTCIPFIVCSLQSCWRKKKSLWTVKCTCLRWEWPRPSSSRGSCPSWSSEKGQRQGTIYTVAWGSQRFKIEMKYTCDVWSHAISLFWKTKLTATM